ncbi:sugar transferase [Eubacterium callanderi]|uniref:sugar transferase n=1 Tax=Eubacterium callanderi TaxID=53442 RepID=UPI00399BCE1B
MIYKKYGKRCCDIILSIVGLPFFAIVFIPTAIAIKAEDRGPVFYNAPRLGKDGKTFKMYKFRSMKVNAPDIRLEDGSTYNGEDDPRVTKIGKFIRKTSIDETPQLLNVLKGDMSFIGPRPDPPDWLERYPENVKEFLRVRPGITGFSQAYYRNSVDGNMKMQNDLYYANHYNSFFDLKIFFKTILNVIKHENTYKDTKNIVVEELNVIDK